MKILLAGSAHYSIQCFDALRAALPDDSPIEFVGLLTQPDKKSGRGLKTRQSVVADWADNLGIPTYKFESLREPDVVQQIAELRCDILLVVAYGLIIPRSVLSLPCLGSWNVHPSALPLLRGAAPLQYTLHDDHATSACTIIKMTGGLDSGPIVSMRKFDVPPNATLDWLAEHTSQLAGQQLAEALIAAADSKLEWQDQEGPSTYAHKISREDTKFDWNEPNRAIFNRFRAYGDSLGVYFESGGKRVKVHGMAESPDNDEHNDKASGEIVAINDESIEVATSDGVLQLDVLQREGKPRTSASAYVAGQRKKTGDNMQDPQP